MPGWGSPAPGLPQPCAPAWGSPGFAQVWCWAVSGAELLGSCPVPPCGTLTWPSGSLGGREILGKVLLQLGQRPREMRRSWAPCRQHPQSCLPRLYFQLR